MIRRSKISSTSIQLKKQLWLVVLRYSIVLLSPVISSVSPNFVHSERSSPVTMSRWSRMFWFLLSLSLLFCLIAGTRRHPSKTVGLTMGHLKRFIFFDQERVGARVDWSHSYLLGRLNSVACNNNIFVLLFSSPLQEKETHGSSSTTGTWV